MNLLSLLTLFGGSEPYIDITPRRLPRIARGCGVRQTPGACERGANRGAATAHYRARRDRREGRHEMTQITVSVTDRTLTRLHKLNGAKNTASFPDFTGALLDALAQPNSTIIGIEPSVWRIYQAEAEKRGITGGATEFIEALLADWPAILAPVAPKGAVVEAQETPFGGGY